MKKKQIIYYKDELNDEFSTAKIVPKKIDGNFKYIHKNPIWDMLSFAFQNILSMPIKLFYVRFKLKIKYIGKEKLKEYKDKGYFVYANHTQIFADTFIPSLPIFPKRNFFIVNPENISMKPFGKIVELLGAIPVPGDTKAAINFLEVIKKRINKKQSITIYPEAHIWPYYTKIRPFKDVSFTYPVKLKTPVFCMTNTYQAYGKNKDKVKMVTYIDGPFFPDEGLLPKEAKSNLRNKVYECMKKRSENSNIEVIKYIKQTDENSI